MRVFLVMLLAVYCVKQVLTAVIFPPFTGHDEVAHWQFARIVATEGRLPTLHTDTLPGELYEWRRYALHWEELGQWSTFLYTAVHPPLYYALVAPVVRSTNEWTPIAQQYVLRYAAIPFGMLTVVLAFLVARTIFPGDTLLAVTVPTVVAFQPQISYVAAMVNNDIVVIALYSCLLYVLVRALWRGVSLPYAAGVGALFGLAVLTKVSSATALPLIVASFWWSRGTASWQRVLVELGVAAAVTLLVIAPWLAFMYATYGDFTGLGALTALQAPLGLTSEARFVELLFSLDFVMARWRETWGEFGWRLIPISGWILAVLAAVTIAGVAGLVQRALAAFGRRQAAPHLDVRQVRALALLAAACVLSYLAVVQFGTQFVLTQARYFFPSVIGATLLVLFGLETWIAPRHRHLAAGVLVLGMVALNVLIYAAHVVPYWYPNP